MQELLSTDARSGETEIFHKTPRGRLGSGPRSTTLGLPRVCECLQYYYYLNIICIFRLFKFISRRRRRLVTCAKIHLLEHVYGVAAPVLFTLVYQCGNASPS